jgi:DNA-binding MurR/RpiR family transcriptional regulator
MTIAEDVRERLDGMSPSERSVARALFAAYPTAGLESLPQLAEAASVTGPTVLRFVRKIGYDGYPEFQRALRTEVQARMEGMLSLYDRRSATQTDDPLHDERAALSRVLEETLASRSLAVELPQVAALLADTRRRAWFAGGRFSRLAAEYLCALVRMLRPGCALIGPSSTDRAVDALEIGKGDVACIFDYRRYQADTVAVGHVAAERGATVVVFTDPWLSPAVESARHVLVSGAESASAIDSMLGSFALAEVVANRTLAALGSAGRDRLERVESTQDRMTGTFEADGQGRRAKR